MDTTKQTKIRSIIVLVAAAVILELTTAVQYFSSRQSIKEQFTEMAQRELNESNHTAALKQEVEEAVANLLTEIEHHFADGNNDSIRNSIRHSLNSQSRIVGFEFCRVNGINGKPDGLYIYRDGEKNTLQEHAIDFDFTRRSWYSQAIRQKHFWSEPYSGRYKETLMCTFSCAVHDANGNVVGVLGADVPLQEVSALIAQLYDAQRQSLMLIILLHLFGLVLLAFIIQRSVRSIRKLEKVDAIKQQIENELNIAGGIQKAMVPKTFPPYPKRNDVDIYALLTPAREVGGDFYDFIIRDEKLFFCIGDVSGKGVPAALVMAVVRSMFRMLYARESAPERIVNSMNDMMTHENEYNMFVTLFVGVLDLPTGRLRYSNAGHKAPYVDGKPLPINPNLPVGIFKDIVFSQQETQLPDESTIFLYTDGLTEAENQNHAQFGVERMKKLLHAEGPRQLIEQMNNAIHEFENGTVQNDDLTMLAIKYNHMHSDIHLCHTISLPCDISQTSRLAEFVGTFCDHIGFTPNITLQVNLALEEAVVNVMNYAYPEGVEGVVNIEATANNQRLKFVISDSGRPFDPTTFNDVDTEQSIEKREIGGLGIYLMRLYMDSISYERRDGQNILTMRKYINNNDKRQL